MDTRPLPLGSGIEQYEQQAREFNPTDSQVALADWYGFESWTELTAWVEEVTKEGSPVAQFESAVDAIVAGDVATFTRMLREHPELIRARSMRRHHATLLIYVGANGVEGYRQKTPKNAVEVAETLLNTGAEIDAVGDMYGGTTTLGLVATSVHPVLTGVQNELMELLLKHGASIEGVAEDYRGGLIVNACLANGRPGAAEFLAQRGAGLDFAGAAGLGRLDAVTAFFGDDGSLKPSVTPAQTKAGFDWACGYGRTNVVEFLLTKGIDEGELARGETALHYAAAGGDPEIVRLLLQRGAAVDLKDERFGATPLDWALYGWTHPAPEGEPGRYHEVVSLLVAAGSSVHAAWLSDEEKVRTDARMMAELSGARQL